MGSYTTLSRRDSGERAKFTCTDRGSLVELNVFQDVLDSIQRKDSQVRDNEDIYMKGDVFSPVVKYKNCYEKEIYNDVMKFCTLYKNVCNLLEGQNQCLTTEGIAHTISDILQEFYQAVAAFNSEGVNKTKPQNEFHGITLRSAAVWSRQPVIILQHIVSILEKTKELKGIGMLNPIIEMMQHSNPELNCTTIRIFEGAAEAFCKMTWLWITMGIINDPYDEFFVAENETTIQPSSWHMKYYLRKDYVPKTMSAETAKLLVDAGKMLNFLQVTCGEIVPFTVTRQYISCLQYEPHCGLLSLLKGDDNFKCHMYHLFKEYGIMVLIVMKEKFSLMEYFHGVYWYIFLKLSNFGRFFIELIHPFHYHEVQKLRMDTFKKALRRAVIVTSPYTRLKKRMQEAKLLVACWKTTTPMDRLCDVININYDPGGPLKSIFYVYETSYSKIFSFLWKKQHAQFSLCNQRKSLLYLMKKVKLDQWSCESWRTLFWFVSVMMQFIYQLDYYFMYEVIEKEWANFWSILNCAHSIDEVTEFYGIMLTNVLNGTMQTEENMKAKTFLNFFYALVIDVEKIVVNMEKKMLKTNGLLLDPMESMVEIKIFQKHFEKAVKEFMKLMSTFAYNDGLSALCERINFNYYYRKEN